MHIVTKAEYPRWRGYSVCLKSLDGLLMLRAVQVKRQDELALCFLKINKFLSHNAFGDVLTAGGQLEGMNCHMAEGSLDRSEGYFCEIVPQP